SWRESGAAGEKRTDEYEQSSGERKRVFAGPVGHWRCWPFLWIRSRDIGTGARPGLTTRRRSEPAHGRTLLCVIPAASHQIIPLSKLWNEWPALPWRRGVG